MVLYFHHSDSARRFACDQSEEYFAARGDHTFVRMIEHLTVVLLDAVRFLDPLIINFGERFRICRVERNYSDFVG